MNPDPTLHTEEALTLAEERLNDAVEKLLTNQRHSEHPITPTLGMALRLKMAQETPTLRASFDRMTEKTLIHEFADRAQQSFWQKFWKPMSLGLMMGGLLLSVLAPIFTPSSATQTLAEHQKFDSLTEAEVLLGSLPSDAKTEDGVKIAKLRADLHELSLLRLEADLELDEKGAIGSFPHTQLRDNALELIQEEERLVAMVDINVDIASFSGKVSEWPTVNEGVDFETHAKAVLGYKKHAVAWEEATQTWAEELLSNLN